MKAPKCKNCGNEHYGPCHVPEAAKAKFDRTAYQRKLMRERRAKAKEAKP